jgi:hypothetical protein
MLRKVIGLEARLLDQLEKPQPVVEKAAQRAAVSVEVIKDSEFQHAGDSVTWPGNPASLSNMIG